jgi:hypothetical protein
MEKTYVMQEQWDYLIVLDACRYDYFEQVWQKYLHGILEKRLSVGSSTPDWRDKSFPDRYPDTIYVSSNPYINSLVPVRRFLASDHFYKVCDVWKSHWNEEKDTVLPADVTKVAIEIAQKNPNKKVIIHYMQPHEPYLGDEVTGIYFDHIRPLHKRILDAIGDERAKTTLSRRIIGILSTVWRRSGLMGRVSLWRVRKLLRMPPMSHMGAIRRKSGRDGLRKAYRENLEIVLKHVAELVGSLNGRIVVTADHGELLGESGKYGHPVRSSKQLLLEIPWLLIDKGERIVEISAEPSAEEVQSGSESTETNRKDVEERLKALGYR